MNLDWADHSLVPALVLMHHTHAGHAAHLGVCCSLNSGVIVGFVLAREITERPPLQAAKTNLHWLDLSLLHSRATACTSMLCRMQGFVESHHLCVLGLALAPALGTLCECTDQATCINWCSQLSDASNSSVISLQGCTDRAA